MNIENDKGFSGIKNLGNTCFLNSCIQILSHTYELNNLINNISMGIDIDTIAADEDTDQKNGEQNYDKQDALLTKEYNDLIQLMWKQNVIITPNRFLSVLQYVARIKNKEIFTGFAQNDATEFLQFLMDCLENVCAKDDSHRRKINDIFYGKLISTICSINEGEPPKIVSKQSEPFFILNVPIPHKNNGTLSPTIKDCIAKFTDCEVLDGDNKWYNENTKQYEEVIKKYDFETFPQILVITLKRFHNINKNDVLVLFDEILEFCDENHVKYELYGVCNHYGNAFFGHYTAFVKHNSGQWIHFNDHSVEKVTEFSSIVTSNAYCLFYRKV